MMEYSEAWALIPLPCDLMCDLRQVAPPLWAVCSPL